MKGKITWLLICNAEKAYIYDLNPKTLHYLLIAIFEHPESRLKDHELSSDHAGQFGPGTAGKGIYFHADPHTASVKEFAHSIAKFIEQGRTKNYLQQLIICAEPHFQGILYNCLTKLAQELVTTKIAKDYIPLIDRELSPIIHLIHEEIKKAKE